MTEGASTDTGVQLPVWSEEVVERAFDPAALIQLRKQQGWSQEELARRSGLATVTVVKLEQGKVGDPHVSTMARLAAAIGCQIEAFLLDSQVSPASARVAVAEPKGRATAKGDT